MRLRRWIRLDGERAREVEVVSRYDFKNAVRVVTEHGEEMIVTTDDLYEEKPLTEIQKAKLERRSELISKVELHRKSFPMALGDLAFLCDTNAAAMASMLRARKEFELRRNEKDKLVVYSVNAEASDRTAGQTKTKAAEPGSLR